MMRKFFLRLNVLPHNAKEGKGTSNPKERNGDTHFCFFLVVLGHHKLIKNFFFEADVFCGVRFEGGQRGNEQPCGVQDGDVGVCS